MYLIFDTETTGLPRDYNAPLTDHDNWPRCVQIAWQLHDEKGFLIEAVNQIIKPDGFTIPYKAVEIHGISTELALKEGKPLAEVCTRFREALKKAKWVAGHNISFDLSIMGAEFYRVQDTNPLDSVDYLDTKEAGTDYCAIPGGKGGKFKWPTLSELHQKLFNKSFGEAHNAAADVEATARCFFKLIELGLIEGKEALEPTLWNHLTEVGKDILASVQQKEMPSISDAGKQFIIPPKSNPTTYNGRFVHLHNHSQYSVLQSTSSVNALAKMASQYDMPAVALSDVANMYGAFMFWQAVNKVNKSAPAKPDGTQSYVKPIIGCELNVCRDHKDKTKADNGYQILFLAINEKGYQNLSKLSTIGLTEGFYYVPRVDKELILKYQEGLIACTGWIYGEIPSLILNVGEEQAEHAFVWWKEVFGDRFYAELNRHGLKEEEHVNQVLLQFCKKHEVKYFAANNNYYLKKENARAHDILLCIKDNAKESTPIGRGRGFRYGLPNDQFFFTSPQDMLRLFSDLPEALEETALIANRIEEFPLERKVLLPKFDIPEPFQSEDEYLRHLTYEGAKKRYNDITPEISERLDFELKIIANTGYPGYFLIVQDFTNKARELGVSVGPGRGSAAGSAVAYCTGITNIDPIKYDLLFERFLNPDRISMPDIDIDFDDEGREDVIKYVIDKYGKNQVAQIITYSTLGGKSALKDAARVLDYPRVQEIVDLYPKNLAATLSKLLAPNQIDAGLWEAMNKDDQQKAKAFRQMGEGNSEAAQVIQTALQLEGAVRTTGVHACGVIITPTDITDIVPVTMPKEAGMLCTQYDNSVAEQAGLLKMDFLGLKTLTIIKDALKEIKRRHGIMLDPDEFPLDDPNTYDLFQKGRTNGIFQFESAGMQKHMKDLKPDKFEDLIAMNALYRPGPMEKIPNYIARKHGTEKVTYDLADMEEYLAETYGITIYQEQVMRLSQTLADFTKGEADTLRKAMGKKQKDTLDKMKSRFIEGGTAKGHPEKVLDKIWTEWEAFASYAFNKSHSTCYAYLAFQTGYLKANYPAEFMAAVLNHTNNIKDITFLMAECRRMDITVLIPHINESQLRFAVTGENQIRFGLAAIKGVGEIAAQEIINERDSKGKFKSVFDLAKRVNARSVNKRVFEALAYSGAFDGFENTHRAQYFHKNGNDDQTLLEKAIRYGVSYQQNLNAAQVSLFGAGSDGELPEPTIPPCEKWKLEHELEFEKEVVGMYLSAHPLDRYDVELEELTTLKLAELENMDEIGEVPKLVAGMITAKTERESKSGNLYAVFTLEDFSGSFEFMLSSKQLNQFRTILNSEKEVYIKLQVQERPYQPGRKEVNILHIGALREMKGQMLQRLRLSVFLQQINQDRNRMLKLALEKFPGDCPIQVDIIDSEQPKQIPTSLKTSYKVNVCRELLKEIDKMKIYSKLEVSN